MENSVSWTPLPGTVKFWYFSWEIFEVTKFQDKLLSTISLNENWLDCNENLEVGNLDPLVQILLVTYYENYSHSSQTQK